MESEKLVETDGGIFVEATDLMKDFYIFISSVLRNSIFF